MGNVTWLKSPVTGMFYYAYATGNLYDRSIVAWIIYERESDIHSKELFENACRKENAHPKFVHSDFKTVKYRCSYPHHFESLKHERTWFADFIHWYNYEHKHPGLQFFIMI